MKKLIQHYVDFSNLKEIISNPYDLGDALSDEALYFGNIDDFDNEYAFIVGWHAAQHGTNEITIVNEDHCMWIMSGSLQKLSDYLKKCSDTWIQVDPAGGHELKSHE